MRERRPQKREGAHKIIKRRKKEKKTEFWKSVKDF